MQFHAAADLAPGATTPTRADERSPHVTGQARCEPAARPLGMILGVPVHLDIRDPLLGTAADEITARLLAWLRHVDELFSTGRPCNEIGLLDQGLLCPSRADRLVREVLATCARLHERTNGFFDVYATGHLDPSAYVRGWAIQRASALLIEAGAGNHCLRVGDDMRASGRPGEDDTWRVRIEDPCRPRATGWLLSSTDVAIATAARRPCGDPSGGDRIHNPLSRRPASGLSSATIAGPALGVAHAYATAAIAMGPAALDWLPGLDGHAYAVVDDDGRCFHGGGAPGVLLVN